LKKLKTTNKILSPGPGLPDEAGLLKQLIQMYASTKKSILGLVWFAQAIGEVLRPPRNLEKYTRQLKVQIQVNDETI
jgi:anthranilate synthase component 2